MLLPFAAIFVIFYFLLIRPAAEAAAAAGGAVEAMEKGDRAVTAGGAHGVVIGTTDDVLTVEFTSDVGGSRSASSWIAAASSVSCPKAARRGHVTRGRDGEWPASCRRCGHAVLRLSRRREPLLAGDARVPLVLPANGIRLGLDLQGGIHWVLGANMKWPTSTSSIT